MINEVVSLGNHSKIIRLSEDLYFREANLEIRDQCNSGIAVLRDSLAVIDYPEQWPDEEILDEAEGLLKKPVKYILFTHAHLDHVRGLNSLRRKDISIIASKACIEQIRLEGYPVPEVYVAVTQTMDFTLEGFPFRFILPGRVAHSPWDMLIGVPQYKTVFTGDLVVLLKNLFFHTSDIANWRNTIGEIREMGFAWIARGHGPVIGSEYLDEVAGYLELLEKAKNHQAEHHEVIDEWAVHSALQKLSPDLLKIVNPLLARVDAVNVARQINQLSLRTQEGH